MIGGVQTPTVVDCPRCGDKVIIPTGLILRLPASEPAWCHETADPETGATVRRGEPK